jgi:hypothetical protein
MILDEQVMQLVSYFKILTQNHFTEQFGKVRADQLSGQFNQHFDLKLQHNLSLMPDLLSQRHGINAIFLLALAETLQKETTSLAGLQDHMLSIYRNMLKDLLAQQTEALETSDDTWEHFISSVKIGNNALYDNAYFQIQYTNESNEQFGFDIRRCFYYEILEKNGHPELGPLLCEFDYILADNVTKWIQFERPETIANGNPRCTFRYRRTSTRT